MRITIRNDCTVEKFNYVKMNIINQLEIIDILTQGVYDDLVVLLDKGQAGSA
jgi:hypothetical protein